MRRFALAVLLVFTVIMSVSAVAGASDQKPWMPRQPWSDQKPWSDYKPWIGVQPGSDQKPW